MFDSGKHINKLDRYFGLKHKSMQEEKPVVFKDEIILKNNSI